jgi:hypothetical protein
MLSGYSLWQGRWQTRVVWDLVGSMHSTLHTYTYLRLPRTRLTLANFVHCSQSRTAWLNILTGMYSLLSIVHAYCSSSCSLYPSLPIVLVARSLVSIVPHCPYWLVFAEMYDSSHHFIWTVSQSSQIATSPTSAGLAQLGLQVTGFIDQPSICSSWHILQTEDWYWVSYPMYCTRCRLN